MYFFSIYSTFPHLTFIIQLFLLSSSSFYYFIPNPSSLYYPFLFLTKISHSSLKNSVSSRGCSSSNYFLSWLFLTTLFLIQLFLTELFLTRLFLIVLFITQLFLTVLFLTQLFHYWTLPRPIFLPLLCLTKLHIITVLFLTQIFSTELFLTQLFNTLLFITLLFLTVLFYAQLFITVLVLDTRKIFSMPMSSSTSLKYITWVGVWSWGE
jgi:hypothetical protein